MSLRTSSRRRSSPSPPGSPLARRLVRRRREMLIPSTTSTALGNQEYLIGVDHLAEDLAGVRVANFGARGTGR